MACASRENSDEPGHLPSQIRAFAIGVAPITQYTHMRYNNSNTQGSSPNVVKVIFHTLRNCSYRKDFAPSVSEFFPLREIPILIRDVIVENYYLIQ